jgi:predicted nucleic acid-binding protein
MSAERALCFVDTNVLVYAFEKGASPRKRAAQKLLNHLMDTDTLRLSTQVLQELFVTLTRKAVVHCGSEEALGVLDDLAAWPVTVVDYPTIREAVTLSDQVKISFWDSLVVVSAAQSGASTLYTEDLNHGQETLGITITNPFTDL